MLDRALLRHDPEHVRAGCARKGFSVDVAAFLELDRQARALQTDLDQKRANLNQLSKAIGALISSGDATRAEAAKNDTKQLKAEIAAGEDTERALDAQLTEFLLSVPNPPHESVPDGTSEEHNVVVSESGERREFAFEPKPHWEIAERLGIIDFERGAKIAGSGFIVYRGLGAKLQRALFNFMVDYQTSRGYTEIYPPFVVNRESLIGTGQLPKFGDDLYRMERDDLFLIPTAEVPVTNLHRDEIFEPDDLPIKYAAFSACFRREAGAAGKDTRGLLRVHEFDKVELVKFVAPEDSYAELESMTADACSVISALGLSFRVTLLCAGEMSFANAKCYDLELFAPGVDRYLEVSSASNFESFQARRANIRYRPERGAKPEFVHTLNASGVACPRLMAAILETNQQADGSVVIPEPLRPYVGTDKIELL